MTTVYRRLATTSRWVLLLLLLAACEGQPVAPPAHPPVSPTEAYIETIIGIMQANSYHRLRIDWPSFRTRVLAEARHATTIPELYPAIRLALTLLDDNHSFYQTSAGQVLVGTRTLICAAPAVSEPVLPPNIGYVRINAFSGTSAAAAAYANGIRDLIATADSTDLIGWIVDLRGNGGGNMWPMLAGVGSVLGTGVAGHFIDPLGVATPWEYRDSAAWLGGQKVQEVRPYELRRPAPRVAVLTDNRVASSGEAIVIAFRGRPNTRSFGRETCGVSTANLAFALSDGARLLLTTSVMADRTRQPYGHQVHPDEIIADPVETVQRAVQWLESFD